MAGVVATGWESKTTDEIQEAIKAAIWGGISPAVDLSSSTVVGQFIGATASELRQLWEAGQALYAARDPDQAENAQLEELSRITGANRDAAAPSTVLMDITLAAGTYTAGSLIVYATGKPNVRFSNDEEIVTAGATLTDQPFTCTTAGANAANMNTLTQIASPVAGFSAPNNPAAATTGTARETDSELRVKREESLARTGSTTVDAIRADVLAVATVTSCTVLENVGDVTDGNGLPPHSVAAYVRGGDDADIAAAIFESKAGGIATHGSTSVTHVDSQGQNHTINFTRPSQVRVYVTADVTVLDDVYPENEFRTAEVAIHDCGFIWGPTLGAGLGAEPGNGGEWGVGKDVIYSRIRAAIMMMPGVVDVTDLRIGTSPAPTGQVNIVVGIDEYADIDYVDISVTETTVTEEP